MPGQHGRALADLGQQPIAGSDSAKYPFFSPDGRSIGFWDGRQLESIPVEGGTATPLAQLQEVQGASWGPGGIVVSSGGKLVLVPSGGDTPVPLTPGAAIIGYVPLVLPGGDAVVYATSLGAERQLAVTVPATGRTSSLDMRGSPVGVAGGELYEKMAVIGCGLIGSSVIRAARAIVTARSSSG